MKERKCQINSILNSIKEGFWIFVLDMIIFDLWFLMKTRQLLLYFQKAFAPTCKVLSYASFCFGFVAMIAITMVHLESMNKTREVKSIGQHFPAIESIPKTDTAVIMKELLEVKEKSKYLEYMLKKTNMEITDLRLYEKYKDNDLPDFASDSVGGFIVSTPDTEPYISNTYLYIFGIPLWKTTNYSPRKILQPWTEAGECWSFKGDHGKIEIQLAYAIHIESVTLEHIPASSSLTGSINSAPKNFHIYVHIRHQYHFLDSFAYNIDGDPSQTFRIKNHDLKRLAVKRILLEITSNWGNCEYTCIYRFKVHGKIFKGLDDEMISRKPE